MISVQLQSELHTVRYYHAKLQSTNMLVAGCLLYGWCSNGGGMCGGRLGGTGGRVRGRWRCTAGWRACVSGKPGHRRVCDLASGRRGVGAPRRPHAVQRSLVGRRGSSCLRDSWRRGDPRLFARWLSGHNVYQQKNCSTSQLTSIDEVGKYQPACSLTRTLEVTALEASHAGHLELLSKIKD